MGKDTRESRHENHRKTIKGTRWEAGTGTEAEKRPKETTDREVTGEKVKRCTGRDKGRRGSGK